MPTQPRLLTPEEQLDTGDSPLLALDLCCNACGKKRKIRARWATIEVEVLKTGGWDGILLSEIFECLKCGAVDDYQLTPSARLTLMGSLMCRATGEPSRVLATKGSVLWDGTPVRRPSQALARLRELTLEHPQSAQAWRRLGNGCERWELIDEALRAWAKAIELEPKDLEAGYSLVTTLCDLHAWEQCRQALALALTAAWQWSEEPDLKRAYVEGIVECADRLSLAEGSPVIVTASWPAGGTPSRQQVCISAAELGRVRGRAALVDFLLRADILLLRLTPERVQQEDTILERLLNGEDPRGGPIMDILRRPAPVIVGPKTGRNDPCSCGSGKKFKRCCAA